MKSYEYYSASYDQAYFSHARDQWGGSPRPQLEFYPALFAMRMRLNESNQFISYQAGVIQFVSDGEGIINMGGCCGEYVPRFLHDLIEQMVAVAWEQAWQDSSRVMLDTIIGISRKFAVGTQFYPKWLLARDFTRLYYADRPEAIRLLDDQNHVEVVNQIKEIIRQRFGK